MGGLVTLLVVVALIVGLNRCSTRTIILSVLLFAICTFVWSLLFPPEAQAAGAPHQRGLDHRKTRSRQLSQNNDRSSDHTPGQPHSQGNQPGSGSGGRPPKHNNDRVVDDRTSDIYHETGHVVSWTKSSGARPQDVGVGDNNTRSHHKKRKDRDVPEVVVQDAQEKQDEGPRWSIEHIPERNPWGDLFYNRLYNLVDVKISHIFSLDGEWPGGYNQREIEDVREALRREFPALRKYKHFNWKIITRMMGSYLRRKREHVIKKLKRDKKNLLDWSKVPVPENISANDFKIALQRAKDPEQKHSQRTAEATKNLRKPSHLGSGGRPSFIYRFERIYGFRPTNEYIKVAGEFGATELFRRLTDNGTLPRALNRNEAVGELDRALADDALHRQGECSIAVQNNDNVDDNDDVEDDDDEDEDDDATSENDHSENSNDEYTYDVL